MSPRRFDPYATLQVTPTAEAVVITAAYRALARLYHPDHNGAPEAMARMAAINAAYEFIGEPRHRKAYDREISADQNAARPTGSPQPAPAPAASTWRPATPPSPPTARTADATSEAPAPRKSAGSGKVDTETVLDFGRYPGRSIREISRLDPDYLLWLSTSSRAGVYYRGAIRAALAEVESVRSGGAFGAASPARPVRGGTGPKRGLLHRFGR